MILFIIIIIIESCVVKADTPIPPDAVMATGGV